MTQFLVGMVPAVRIAGLARVGLGVARGAEALGAAPRVAAAAGNFLEGELAAAVADQAVFDPFDPKLSDLVQSHPALSNPVTEFLAADPGDTEADARLKRAAEGLGLGAIGGAFLAGLRGVRAAQRDLGGAIAKADERYPHLRRLEDLSARAADVPGNIATGRWAADEVLRTKGTVTGAMVRADLGEITFDYGSTGRSGSGLAHVIARRGGKGVDGEMFARESIPEIIAQGRLVAIEMEGPWRSAVIAWKGDRVILKLFKSAETSPRRETWVLTGYPVEN